MDIKLENLCRCTNVRVLNLDGLYKTIKPKILFRGQHVDIYLAMPGKKSNQAIGYAEHGQAVAVNEARELIGQKRTVKITGSTPDDRLFFGELSGPAIGSEGSPPPPQTAASTMSGPHSLGCSHATDQMSKRTMPQGVTTPTTQAISTAYETAETSVLRTPPPDLPSLLLRERIIYLGLPLFSDDQVKQQLGVDVTELIIAQLLYLEFDNPDKPIFFYINSTGTSWYSGEAVGFETEAFAVCDTLRYVRPPVHTICIGQAMGTAAMILSAGAKGYRAALPHASIVLHQPRSGARGQASDIRIRAQEVLHNKRTMLTILATNTGHTVEELARDSDRMTYMTAEDAKEYGLIDRVLASRKELPAPPPPTP